MSEFDGTRATAPGTLISRDGTVRDYVGHANRSGTVFGIVRLQSKGVWQSVCSGCGTNWYRTTRAEAAVILRDHWTRADADMAEKHQWKPRT